VKVFLLFLLLINHAWGTQESPQSFVFQGRLFDSAGTNPLSEAATLKFEIYAPNGTCLLYSEQQSIDVTFTAGSFAVNVGSATGSPKRALTGTDPGLTMAQVFKNDPTAATRGCYTPTAGDTRKLRVTVTPASTGIAEILSPDQVIGSVGQAIVAETLQGLYPSAFVQKDVFISDTNLAMLFGNPTLTDASTLHHHDGRYIRSSSTSTQTFGTGGFTSLGIASAGTGSQLSGATLSVQTASAASPGIVVKASASQSADLLQVQDSSGAKLGGFSSTGALSALGQFVLSYDSTNKLTFDVSSVGLTTLTAAGSSPKFSFMGGNSGFGTASPVGKVSIFTNDGTMAALNAIKSASKPAFSLLPWDSQVYFSAGAYWSGSSWTHNSDDANSELFVLDPGSGATWFSSNNSSASWNISNGATLWDSNGYWKMPVQYASNGSSYFMGAVGVGTTSPNASVHVLAGTTASMKIEGDTTGAPSKRAYLQLHSQDAAVGSGLGILTSNASQTNWFFGEGYGGFGYTIGYGASQPEYAAQSKLTINTSGYVGINASSPTSQLHVANSTSSMSVPMLNLDESFGSPGGRPLLKTNRVNNLAVGNITVGNAALRMVEHSSNYAISVESEAAASLFVVKGSTTGINTSTPAGSLEVVSTATNPAVIARNSSSTNSSNIRLYNDQNSSVRALNMAYTGSGTTTYWGVGSTSGEQGAIGTTGNYPLTFATNSLQRMMINTSGNLAVGATSASEKLSVAGNGLFGTEGSTRTVVFGGGGVSEYYASDVNPRWNIGRDAVSAGQSGILFKNATVSGDATFAAAGVAVGAAGAGKSLGFYTSNGTALTERGRFDLNGNMGIGTTTTTVARLNVDSGTSALAASFSSSATSTGLILNNTSTNGKKWVFYSSDNTGAGGTFGTSSLTLRNGTDNLNVMTLLPAGNVGIGNINPAYKLDVTGDINASLTVKANGVTLTSDKRLKRDITGISNSMEKILFLNGYNYFWKDKSKHGDKKEIGLIAQEVEKVFPEVVTTHKDGFKSVAYPNLIAPVIEALKDLYKRINSNDVELKREIASIKEENRILKERLDRLEKSLQSDRQRTPGR